jgi:hypothetical protein
MQNETQVTEAVSSILDIEHSTATIGEFKGKPMFVINKDSKYPFSFGIPKAKVIVKHLKPLLKFVETDGKEI